MMRLLYNLLESPLLYRMVQLCFAPGAEKLLTKALSELSASLPTAGKILDVGCGPSSWLWKVGRKPIGFDLSHSYTTVFSQSGNVAVTGSCFNLPFIDNSFAGVWCIGVLHHLSDTEVRHSVGEMLRVCRPGGHVVILDAVLPEPLWKRPVAAIIRRLDRGKYMRTENRLKSLMPEQLRFQSKRYTYTYTGLEMFETVIVHTKD